jgi:hypothetical protein
MGFIQLEAELLGTHRQRFGIHVSEGFSSGRPGKFRPELMPGKLSSQLIKIRRTSSFVELIASNAFQIAMESRKEELVNDMSLHLR